MSYDPQRVQELAYSSMTETGRAYNKDIYERLKMHRLPVSRALQALAQKNGWAQGKDRRGIYYEITAGNAANGALIRAGVLNLPGKEFGELMDGLSGNGAGRQGTEESEYGSEIVLPIRIRPQELQTPTARCMLVKTTRHLIRAAYDLRRTYTDVKADFSSGRAMNSDVRQLGHALDGWRVRYWEDLIMPDSSGDYVGVSVVGEDYIAKRFGITKTEAVGAIRAMMKMPVMDGRVFLTNQQIPVGKFVIVDYMPPIPDSSPRFNMKFRVSRDNDRNDGNGTRKNLIAELANVA